MRIIEESKTARCDKCKALIGFEVREMKVGEFGCKYIICPNCKERIWLDVEDCVILTANNVQYPQHFHFPKDAKKISNEEIQESVERAAKYTPKDGYYIAYYSGDTMVVGFDCGEEENNDIEIYVIKNPASTIVRRPPDVDF